MPTRIIIFEDNDLLRESVGNMIALNPSLELAGSFDNVLTIEEKLQTLQPDILFMDIDMPGMSGIEAVKKVRKVNPDLPILMLTVFDDNNHVFDALCAGASGYLLKKHISDRLFDAIKEIMAGGAPMSPNIARMVIKSMQRVNKNAYQLTSREKEILTLLSKGNSTKLIAADLGISFDTVRTHIKKIYEKLQVHSQTEAVSKAINEKIV